MQSSILEEDEIGRLVDLSESILMKGGPSVYKRETEFLTLAAAPKIALSYIYLKNSQLSHNNPSSTCRVITVVMPERGSVESSNAPNNVRPNALELGPRKKP